jgi:hypothetical protein
MLERRDIMPREEVVSRRRRNGVGGAVDVRGSGEGWRARRSVAVPDV